jgi:hypothetical protein
LLRKAYAKRDENIPNGLAVSEWHKNGVSRAWAGHEPFESLWNAALITSAGLPLMANTGVAAGRNKI